MKVVWKFHLTKLFKTYVNSLLFHFLVDWDSCRQKDRKKITDQKINYLMRISVGF